MQWHRTRPKFRKKPYLILRNAFSILWRTFVQRTCIIRNEFHWVSSYRTCGLVPSLSKTEFVYQCKFIPFSNKKSYCRKKSYDANEGREVAHCGRFRIHYTNFYLFVLHKEPSWWWDASKYDNGKKLNWKNVEWSNL